MLTLAMSTHIVYLSLTNERPIMTCHTATQLAEHVNADNQACAVQQAAIKNGIHL